MRRALLLIVVLVAVPAAGAAEVDVTVAAAEDVQVGMERVADRVWEVWVQNRGSVTVTARPYIGMIGSFRVEAAPRTVAPGELMHARVAVPYPGRVGVVGFGNAGIVADASVAPANRSTARILVVRPYQEHVRVEVRFQQRREDGMFVSVNRSDDVIRQHRVTAPAGRGVLDHRFQSPIMGAENVTVAVTDTLNGEKTVRTVSRRPLDGVAAFVWNLVEDVVDSLFSYESLI